MFNNHYWQVGSFGVFIAWPIYAICSFVHILQPYLWLHLSIFTLFIPIESCHIALTLTNWIQSAEILTVVTYCNSSSGTIRPDLFSLYQIFPGLWYICVWPSLGGFPLKPKSLTPHSPAFLWFLGHQCVNISHMEKQHRLGFLTWFLKTDT